ncbi:MAG: transketolase family protein [Candidatus Omnitrophota bacterium]
MIVEKPTRDGFGEGLLELGETNKDVVVLTADLSASVRAQWFMDKYPLRSFKLGVAEQDMIGTAAGLSLGGKIPFAGTFGVFASGRAWDQLRVSVCYMNLNVNIAASHGGISVGEDGATHQALEDITLMRALPNMTVVVPCDALEAKKATIASASYPGPVYLRLGKQKVPFMTSPEAIFNIGKADILRTGKDITIFACGLMVAEALKAGELLTKKGIDARIINMHTISPIDIQAIIDAAQETRAIVTIEEHSLTGGLGSAVAEVVVERCPVPMKMIGIRSQFGQSGKPLVLLKEYGLTAEDIKNTIIGFLETVKPNYSL